MQSVKTTVNLRDLTLLVLGSLALIAGSIWVGIQFVEPPPPDHFSIAAASKGSPYYTLAERYQAHLAKNGVRLDIRETGGSFDNLKLLTDPAFGIGLAFMQGGIAAGDDFKGMKSLGRVMYEPLWIFAHTGSNIDKLADLAGRRILVGPAGGGTNNLAARMLGANDVTRTNAEFVNMELPDYVDALENGRADAGFLVLAASAKTVQRLFNSPHVKLVNLAQADAYAERFPFLSPLILKQGVIDFAKNIPPSDTHLVATRTMLAVRDDLHPALANLMTQALIAVHGEPALNAKGEAAIFAKSGEFPMATDPELAISDQAKRVYRSGPPFLQRYLPFGLATLFDRLLVLAVPLIGIALPIFRFAPMIYTWRIRQRLLYWYKELKKIERGVDSHADPVLIAQKQVQIEEVEEAVNRIPIPLSFTNQLYDLRQHIDVVRRHLSAVAATA